MANFTEDQIQKMLWELKNEYCGPEIATQELAILELEDLKRKGCTLENIGECHGCSATKNGECPLCNWEKRHPEYANDELAMKIKVLEAGGEEAYQKKLEAAKKHDMKYTIDIEHCLVGNGQELDEYRIMDVDGNIVASTYDKKHAEDILKLAKERW